MRSTLFGIAAVFHIFPNKVTRVMRVEAPRQFLPNVRSSGVALAKGKNSEQIWPDTRNFAKLLMFHERVFLLDAP